jgi:uncharacterized short protein YbdD (DUF466 family)
MNRAGHEDVDFFVGTEVEHTPVLGMKTLFVVGVQDHENIVKHVRANDAKHIYFGANQSFPRMLDVNDAPAWQCWERMILAWLDAGFWCTLDLDVACVEGLLEGPLVGHDNFIPMISVKLPYIQQLGYNAIIKLDDRDFRATNPGVWCHSVHALQDRTKFTAWSQYAKDEVIK